MKLPTLEQLKRNYPVDSNPATVMHAIGGGIANLNPRTNTCVMRMSRAFNYAGRQHEIPANQKHPLLRTIPGKDRKNYAYNVQEFLAYLAYRYGPPAVSRRYSEHEKESSVPFLNKTGIIAWRIQGWGDATGHFTLWDGKTGLYEGEHDYFSTFPYTVTDQHGMPRTVRETGADLWTC